jgi:hypothetical protein
MKSIKKYFKKKKGGNLLMGEEAEEKVAGERLGASSPGL